MAQQNIPIEQMDFKALRAKVQEQEDSLARLKRIFEDALQNIDFDNFSGSFRKEAENFKSEFSMTAKEIKLSVSALGESMSELSVQADKIYSRVTKTITTSFTLNEMPTAGNTSDLEKTMVCEYEGVRYYFNDLMGEWQEYPDDGLRTYFEQNADGFYYLGGVKIDGSLIVSDSITADKIKAGLLRGHTIQSFMSSESDGYGTYVELNGNKGSLDFYYTTSFGEPEKRCEIFQASGATYIRNVASALNIGCEPTGGNTNKTKAIGDWDFSDCNITWGTNRLVAVFA